MKPVRLPAAATLALPRWALFALGLLYILPGLIGRDPWKNDDAASFGIMWTMAHGTWQDWLWPNIAGLSWPDEGPLAFWLGALGIKLFGWLLGDVLAARVGTSAVSCWACCRCGTPPSTWAPQMRSRCAWPSAASLNRTTSAARWPTPPS
jgi:4-amino-4-deoxy-L-arabinose transferase-like glycosyltransferase